MSEYDDDDVTGGLFVAAITVAVFLVVVLGVAAWALVAWL